MKAHLPETNQKRIVIIGGGFGGLKLARELSNSNYQIVLIDKNNYHQFQPLFYQVATAGLEPSSISFPFRKIFQKSTNVLIRVAEIIRILIINGGSLTNGAAGIMSIPLFTSWPLVYIFVIITSLKNCNNNNNNN